MDKAEAKAAMSSIDFTVETKTIKDGAYEFIHYRNTRLNHETILRLNPAGMCDQLITVMPLEKWEEYVKLFNGQHPTLNSKEATWTPAGKNTWKKADGTIICTLIPQENKTSFSLVMATPEARN